MRRKLRIGFNARYLRDYNLRGFNRYTMSLLTELQSQDEFEIILFTDQRSPIHPAFAKTIVAETIELASPKALLWEQVMLPLALRRQNIGLFHAPADGGLPAWKRCPYVLTYHHALDKSVRRSVATGELPGRVADYCPEASGLQGTYQRYRHSLLRSVYLRAADKIIAVSNYGKWELVELLGVADKKVEVIYEAADVRFSPDISEEMVNEAKTKYGLPDRYLLFVGSFESRKNVYGLLRAFAEAKRAGVRHGLVLVGIGGDIQGARTMARQLALFEDREVVFLERIHEDLAALYRGATAFVTLSWGESFGLPVVEAMCCGTPVIVSNRGGLPEIVGDGGILVDPRNSVEVVQAIKEVTSRTELQAHLRTEALGRAKAFSWKKTAEQTLKVYESVLGTSPRYRVADI
jgi:glycosyltransferase involved in cell wall biosynthesis